jgi:hypothetical protein
MDRKKARHTAGYTHANQQKSSAAWFGLATSYNAAALVLHGNQDKIPSDSRPFVMNAALSLELILKSILTKRGLPIPHDKGGHNLHLLCSRANVSLSDNQKLTLELLTETLIWAGRYPIPKTEDQWNNYNDLKLEKHVIRGASENVYRVIANRETFPTLENYLKIWEVCVGEFQSPSI